MTGKIAHALLQRTGSAPVTMIAQVLIALQKESKARRLRDIVVICHRLTLAIILPQQRMPVSKRPRVPLGTLRPVLLALVLVSPTGTMFAER